MVRLPRMALLLLPCSLSPSHTPSLRLNSALGVGALQVPHFPGVSEAAAAACLQLVYAAFVSSGDGVGDADDGPTGSTAKACALNVGAAGGDPCALTPALFAAAAMAAGLAAEAFDTTAAGLTAMGLLSGVKAGRIHIVPYLSGVDPSQPLCDGTGTLSFAIIVVSGCCSSVTACCHTHVNCTLLGGRRCHLTRTVLLGPLGGACVWGWVCGCATHTVPWTVGAGLRSQSIDWRRCFTRRSSARR